MDDAAEPAVTWDLPGDLSAGAVARERVRVALAEVDPALREDCALVASELAVNAVRHGRPPVQLVLERSGGDVRIEVTSGAGSTRPQVREPAAEADSGRGLALVARLSAESGWTEESERVTSWARLRA